MAIVQIVNALTFLFPFVFRLMTIYKISFSGSSGTALQSPQLSSLSNVGRGLKYFRIKFCHGLIGAHKTDPAGIGKQLVYSSRLSIHVVLSTFQSGSMLVTPDLYL